MRFPTSIKFCWNIPKPGIVYNIYMTDKLNGAFWLVKKMLGNRSAIAICIKLHLTQPFCFFFSLYILIGYFFTQFLITHFQKDLLRASIQCDLICCCFVLWLSDLISDGLTIIGLICNPSKTSTKIFYKFGGIIQRKLILFPVNSWLKLSGNWHFIILINFEIPNFILIFLILII